MSTQNQQCFALGPECTSSTCLQRPFTLLNVNIDGNCIFGLTTQASSTVTTSSSTTSSESTISLPRASTTLSFTKSLSFTLSPPLSPPLPPTRSASLSENQSVHTAFGVSGSAASVTPTNTPSVLSSPQTGSHPSNQAGALVGIGLGSALVAVGSTLLCIYLLRRRRRRSAPVSLPEGALPAAAASDIDNDIDIAHGGHSAFVTMPVLGDAQRGEVSPGTPWSERGTLGSTLDEPYMQPSSSDKSAWAGLARVEEYNAAAGQCDDRVAEMGTTFRPGGSLGDSGEVYDLGSLGAPPRYQAYQTQGGRRDGSRWLVESGDDLGSETTTLSTLPPPYAEC